MNATVTPVTPVEPAPEPPWHACAPADVEERLRTGGHEVGAWLRIVAVAATILVAMELHTWLRGGRGEHRD